MNKVKCAFRTQTSPGIEVRLCVLKLKYTRQLMLDQDLDEEDEDDVDELDFSEVDFNITRFKEKCFSCPGQIINTGNDVDIDSRINEE